MYYYSTRDLNKSQKYTSAEVIKKGLADDGGLFIPESIPALSKGEVKELCGDKYPVRAAKILSKFLTDYTYDELLSEINAVKQACDGKLLKVIIETCVLSDEEKIKMCELVTASGADFINLDGETVIAAYNRSGEFINKIKIDFNDNSPVEIAVYNGNFIVGVNTENGGELYEFKVKVE